MPRARALDAAACRRAVPLFAAPSVITQPSIVPRAAQYCAEGLPWGCFVLSEAMNTHARLSILAALLLLGRDELTDMQNKDGGAELTCHFCNNRYDLSAAELQELINALPSAA